MQDLTTGKITQLTTNDPAEATRISDDIKKLEQAMTKVLVTKDGKPIPKHAIVFRVDELIVIKGYTYRVAYFNESSITFEPVKPTDALKEPTP